MRPLRYTSEFVTHPLHQEVFFMLNTARITIDGDGKATIPQMWEEKKEIKESADCTLGLRGILADSDIMSVDNFLKRKHGHKELDL